MIEVGCDHPSPNTFWYFRSLPLGTLSDTLRWVVFVTGEDRTPTLMCVLFLRDERHNFVHYYYYNRTVKVNTASICTCSMKESLTKTL